MSKRFNNITTRVIIVIIKFILCNFRTKILPTLLILTPFLGLRLNFQPFNYIICL